ncbi:glycoside hydrolase family 61 protein [Hypoxylon trugodes]|uniref:glycoside hydrolase family 61 protein n=1 Tax=Hypoxylon trugodes TaxID=326681 RepID=UPI002191801A|nr:glycoside hydrolase family 61 protein [Hypoxylon trugodes]KAI1388197.1 glycoside hydrolase family 61 protein [Hypoxylon trugodes]
MAFSNFLLSVILPVLLSAVSVQAHGIASAIVIDSTFYDGYNPSYQYKSPPPTVVGWSVPDDLQNTFIAPNQFSTPDMVCHLGAKPAGAAAPVKGGDIIEVQWTPWPASHKGPVLDYLAKCDGACETADKAKLKFFKIGEAGWVDKASDLWAANVLTNNNNSWLVRIPEDIAPGNYVLRHEIIALHAAANPNGAQSYPFCFNLAIDSKGTAAPDGIPATQFYKTDDPGIKFDLFSHPTAYVIPGPKLYSGALPVSQTKPAAITATATGVYAFTAAAHVRAAVTTTAALAADAAPTTFVVAAKAVSPAVPQATQA